MTCELCHYATPVVRIYKGMIFCPDCEEKFRFYEEMQVVTSDQD
jgi:uncharacterized Zn finger protein (UPF0148 family)